MVSANNECFLKILRLHSGQPLIYETKLVGLTLPSEEAQ